jgi:NAD(P)-dependent dehydrogenase (short-subunit alcohol dehydrogenase family)
MSEQDPKHCLVIGVGPGTGLATVKHFAAQGYNVSMIARHPGRLETWEGEIPGAKGYATDIGETEAFVATLKRIAAERGSPSVVIYNATLASRGSYEDIAIADFERNFRVNAAGLLATAQTLCPAMVERGDGALICTGNTGALRGRPTYIGWTPTKAAQRMVAEALARDLGPKGVHVGYVVIDAVIDMPFARKRWPDFPDDFYAKPEDLASEIYHLAHQPRSARTFLLELRPFGEKW